MTWSRIWLFVRKYLINKYVIALLVFAVILSFCGNQSLFNQAGMQREINRKEKELREYHRKTEEAEHQLRVLENPDSLERFAREQYFMRQDGEDVFLIRE